MNILLVIAGILDPKWPLPAMEGPILPARAADRLILSPFEQSAMELALRLRDAGPDDVSLSAMLIGEETARLAVEVGSYRIDDIMRTTIDPQSLWDTPALMLAIAAAVRAMNPGPDIVFLGREVGDCDDGLLAPLLAAELNWNFFGLAQGVRTEPQPFALMREGAGVAEHTPCTSGLIASVTNDHRNRLRRPLMKNLLAARKRDFPLSNTTLTRSGARLNAVVPRIDMRSNEPCHFLAGPLQDQVAELAERLNAVAHS